MVFGRRRAALSGKPVLLESLLRSVLLYILPKIMYIRRILAAGRRVCRRLAVVLQELIHRLQRLVVLIEDLQVIHGSGRLRLVE